MTDPSALPTDPGQPPSAPPESMFSQQARVRLGLASFAFATGVFVYGIVAPHHFEHPMARGALLLAFGLYSAVFWFVMWPENVVLKDDRLTLGVRIAGPVALMIILIVMYSYYLPTDYAYGGEVFRIKPTNGPAEITYLHNGTRLDYSGEWYEVPDPKNKFLMHGLYVRFPRGSNQVTAELTLWNCKPKVVSFKRGAGEVALAIERTQ